MIRAKNAITILPSTAGDVDYETGGSADFFGDESGDSEDEAMDIGGEVGSSSRSGFQHARDVNTIKGDIEEMKKAILDKMDSKLPEATMLDIKRQLRKNSDLATKIDALDTRIKVIVPSITISKPPVTNSIDLINAAAANFRAVEKKKLSPLNWEKIDDNIQRKFELVKEPVKSAIHHYQVKQISVNEMSMNYLERGQSSCIKSPKDEIIMKPRVNYPKLSLKNPLDTVYETPKPDEKKLLSRSIAFYKDPADSASKKRIAKIFRNGKEICVPSEIIESQDPKKQVEQQKKSPRIKELAKRTKRKLDIVDKELENQFPKESTSTTTQASKPSVIFEDIKVVDPYRNIHGEPIVPKDELIEWENIPIPDFNLPILSKPKRTKSRAVKKEFSDLNLYLDKLDEVRGIDAYRNLPEREKSASKALLADGFMDDKGVRIFFRLEDQLSISSNETLLEMQEKLNLSESDELEFHKQLQNQIEENNRKLRKRSRPSRN
ncbi:hypothetical protein AgCh_000751 [Apium graveolens]